jgi:hypothetical protein
LKEVRDGELEVQRVMIMLNVLVTRGEVVSGIMGGIVLVMLSALVTMLTGQYIVIVGTLISGLVVVETLEWFVLFEEDCVPVQIEMEVATSTESEIDLWEDFAVSLSAN